jgi:hydrogenase nickel incorporation protein HypB
MCTTCGCGDGETRVEGEALHAHEHTHTHADGTTHSHTHDHTHAHGHGDGHDHSHHHPGQEHHGHEHGHDHTHAHDHAHPHDHSHHDHGHEGGRLVKLEQDILAKNNTYAAKNREWFAERGIFALNLVSSPGSGKTTLLCKTIEALKARGGKHEVAVIEGDQQTSHDAERIRATGAPAIQINTGKGCHLDAHMVGHALEKLPLAEQAVLMIENVGNLVCPAAFDLGEAGKVVILSVTEGEDKPLKYPDMFRAARLMLVNKCDLLPYLQFDVEQAIAHARRVNPQIEVMRVSATTGEGMDAWLAWIEKGAADAGRRRQDTVAALKKRIAELEAQLQPPR